MEHKHKSPDVAVTTLGAIDKSNQSHITYDRTTNQGPRHVSFFLRRVMDFLLKRAGGISND
jgi:hypothetical protein